MTKNFDFKILVKVKKIKLEMVQIGVKYQTLKMHIKYFSLFLIACEILALTGFEFENIGQD